MIDACKLSGSRCDLQACAISHVVGMSHFVCMHGTRACMCRRCLCRMHVPCVVDACVVSMHATRHDGNASKHDAESRARKQDAESSAQVLQLLQVSLIHTHLKPPLHPRVRAGVGACVHVHATQLSQRGPEARKLSARQRSETEGRKAAPLLALTLRHSSGA
jgi:hypothetical protein